MDNRAIGVFDSGFGGLTVMKQLEAVLPGESLIYFGDTGRAPYGGRPRETLLQFGRENIEFLLGFDVKLIIAACGTVSAVGLPLLRGSYDVPLFGIIDSGAKAAAGATSSGRLGIIATQASILSGAYQSAVMEIDKQLYIKSVACPKFVPLVESGRFRPEVQEVRDAVSEHLSELRSAKIDTLLLGCTHYPILAQAIQEYMGSGVTLIDAGAAAAMQLRDYLCMHGLQCGEGAAQNTQYYTSGSSEAFNATAGLIFGKQLRAIEI